MSEAKTKDLRKYHVRAKVPKYFRVAAVGALILTVLAVGIGFYRARNRAEFRMQGFPTELSKDVIAEVDGYERRETEGSTLKYYIKADKATTFSDNHMELENVFLEVFDPEGTASDKITADKAVQIPEADKNFTAYFAGSVNIDTRDGLKVKTEQVTYKKSDETATAEEAIEFQRDNVHGRSFGAIVKVAEKRIELLRDVEISASERANADEKQVVMKSGFASYDQGTETVELEQNVDVKVRSKSGSADVLASRAKALLVAAEGGREVKQIELFENVRIATRQGDGKPTNINSGYALYEREIERFDLRQGVTIVTVEDDRPTNITAVSAVYEQPQGRIFLEGNAEITQGTEFIKGDHITAQLYPTKKLKSSFVRGNAYLRQAAADRTTEVSSRELNAAFNDAQQLLNANALGDGRVVLTPVNATDYSKMTMNAPNAIRVHFKGEGLLDKMFTEGRTTIHLDVPNGAADAANKRVTADTVRTFFNADGKDLAKAEAIGNAELNIDPLRAGPENYKTAINAPRFDCDFFPTGNNVRQCVAATKAKAVRTPTVNTSGRGTQTATSDTMTAVFNAQSKDVERLDAAGDAKFTELDRNAIAETFSYTQGDQTVRLRNGEPTVWDMTARAKAREIDWDTKSQKSFLRGAVSTTYYSQKQTGGATPFAESNKPVFFTAENAEFDHRAETGVYLGNARGWQENNYVRAERFLIQQREAQFFAEGTVQSLLYNAKRTENGRETEVPVYASSQKMAYNNQSRVLRYENDVDIRQGPDRIVGGIANVFLNDKNEVARTDIENSVVITQPNRRAVGDFAQYIAAEEKVVLRGNPARVDDGENGSSSGGELTVFLRNNRVIGEGKTKQNTAGRTRSVYKVTN